MSKQYISKVGEVSATGTSFSFLPVTSAAFPLSLNIEPVVAFIAKWGIEPNLLVSKFRYAEPLDVNDPQVLGQFLQNLFQSQAYLKSVSAQVLTGDKLWVKTTGLAHGTNLVFSRTPTSLTTLESFDPLLSRGVLSTEVNYEEKIINEACKFTVLSNPAGAVRVSRHWCVPLVGADAKTLITELSDKDRKKRIQDVVATEYTRLPSHGQIVQRLEDVVNGVVITDRLREMLFDPDSELADTLPSTVRSELLLQLFEMLVLGSGLSQSEETILPYIEIAKRLYKDLVAVRRNPSTGAVEPASTTLRIHQATVTAVKPVLVSTSTTADQGSETKADAHPSSQSRADVATKSTASTLPWAQRSKVGLQGSPFKLESKDIIATDQALELVTSVDTTPTTANKTASSPEADQILPGESKEPELQQQMTTKSPTPIESHTIPLFPSFSSRHHRMFVTITPSKKLVTVLYFAHTPAM